ncbi:serine/threonine-protein kinase VRK1 [Tribolium castaneum]|uniref:non-specific serine/threonine protein kinase n=1 Tax=Tribolium castaneum TaxID=7070 RepID=D6WZL1_TRICA|nr:PREDICTED: serine/threonine-protein kinase VRK1 [Tribolium castaneum]EFA10442.1 Nucleosomal histone kinase 1-like Protein [Tribolium castaneum]|eukprot:XP_972858.1 PREDICTED: serine/threonine-protein kinase VRK1 [Tribolium castaneum]
MSKPVKKPRKKATTGYKMPEPLPAGEVLVDVGKNQWRLGPSIGKGGFGEIYAAQEASSKSPKYPYVVKVEPHGNGPLFVEMHFYMKNAKQADIEAFMKKHKLKTFGMPAYLGSGSHEMGASKYRFIVMEKFGADIDQLRRDKGALSSTSVFQMGWQITYVLEYIHDFGYIHGDIKGGNVLLGVNKSQVYLVDFGLATKFSTEREFKPNPKKAHDGTIEYTSRDAHHGVPTRRGDFEILGFNLIHWLGGTLPWDSHLSDPKTVQQLKEDNLKDVPKFIKTCLGKKSETLIKYFQYVNSLKFDEVPDYKKIRSLFEDEIRKNGKTVDSPFDFLGTVKKRRSLCGDRLDDGDDENVTPVKKLAKKKEKKQKEVIENKTEEVMTPAMKEILAKKEKNALKKKKTKTSDDKNGEVDNAGMMEIRKKKDKASEETNGHLGARKKKTKASSDDSDGEVYNAEMLEIKQKINKGRSEEVRENGRPRRHLPACNYDERTPRQPRKKT